MVEAVWTDPIPEKGAELMQVLHKKMQHSTLVSQSEGIKGMNRDHLHARPHNKVKL